MPISALLFDLDNTLFDNDEELEAWANSVIESSFTPSQTKRLLDAIPSIIVKIRLDVARLDEVSRELNILCPGLPAAASELLMRMNRDWLGSMLLNPDAIALLEYLDKLGFPYGIVTNAPPHQQLKIAQLGLVTRAKCVHISGVFGASKPNPSIFLAAARDLDEPCGSILFVGDSAEADVVGAHNVGMQTAWLRRGVDWPSACLPVQPDFTLNALTDIIPILAGNISALPE